MAYCQKCGTELQEGAQFCASCGSKGLPPLSQPAAPVKKGKAGRNVGIGCGALVGLFVLILVIVVATSPKSTPASNTTNSSQTTNSQSVSQPQAKSGVTLANFNKLADGISYRQAVSILGEEGVVSSESNVAGYKTILYTWKADNWGGNMNAMFQNDKLISKAQFGLK